jgi:hypothetical protein
MFANEKSECCCASKNAHPAKQDWRSGDSALASQLGEERGEFGESQLFGAGIGAEAGGC